MSTLQDELDEALRKAQGHSASHYGMASIIIVWNPYECGWEAEANWSNNTRIRTEPHEDPFTAVVELIEILS